MVYMITGGIMPCSNHSEQIGYLKKIEGQIKGVEKMIDEGRYCIDIIYQINSIMGALRRVEGKILKKHLESCVSAALSEGSRQDKDIKIAELVELVEKLRKL
jgi:DNA-binding FrmR family transcriptional regulator